MRAGLATLLLTSCAWITDEEYQALQEPCECTDTETLFYPDEDGDGYGDDSGALTCPGDDRAYISSGGDCDDGDPAVNPGATESCNGIDDDCDGDTDPLTAEGAVRWHEDADGDGHGDPAIWTTACEASEGWVGTDQADDCDDSDPDVYPGNTEWCGDQKDNDCDGLPADCNLEGTQDWELLVDLAGNAADDGLGLAMVGGTDLTGDGVVDLVVGVHRWSEGASEGGAALILAGPIGPEDSPSLEDAWGVLEGRDAELHAGRALALLGDLDGGGEPWLAVGCSPSSPNGSDAGAVHLVELSEPLTGGAMDLSSEATVSLDFGAAGDALGMTLAGGLDVTGDGQLDLAVGAPGTDGNRGAVYLYSGYISSYTPEKALVGTISGDLPGAKLGQFTALIPDMDGDGVGELAVGSGGEKGRGEVLLFLSPSDAPLGTEHADHRYHGAKDGALLCTVAAAGDVDGDGRGDLLLGAPMAGDNLQGAAYLIGGANSVATTIDGREAELTGFLAGGSLGMGLAGFDFDADGHSDLFVSAPGTDNPATNAGITYLFYGDLRGSFSAAAADAEVEGPAANASSGYHLAPVGDLDDDGFAELGIGAPLGSPSALGILYGQGW